VKFISLPHMYKSIRRQLRRHQVTAIGVFAGITISAIAIIMSQRPIPLNYDALLATIAEGESRGNYNAYYGNVANAEVIFTNMTLDEVIQWQLQYVEDGSPSSAVGKYQVIRPTLEDLISEKDLSLEMKFDEQLQDRLAITLIDRRGSQKFARGKLSREDFANRLSQEWAALPNVTGDNPSESYYAGDGLNKSLISVDELLSSIGTLLQPM
jgi:muramidase (phage lysozyme)